MFSIQKSEHPDNSLLLEYRLNDSYVDCFMTDVTKSVALSGYIEAFYTTPLFKMERLILKWVLSKPSTDDDAALLASSDTTSFSAWVVEARLDDQILLSDFQGQTRSWLMLQDISDQDGKKTRLYFGSAVLPKVNKTSGEKRMSLGFKLLLPFHKIYAQALLASARRKLL